MKGILLYDLILAILGDEWMPIRELNQRIFDAKPGTTGGSVRRTLREALDHQVVLRAEDNDRSTNGLAYKYMINPNPPAERPATPIRPIGRPKKKKAKNPEPLFTCKLPKGAVKTSHDARTWRTIDRPILPIRYCKMKNGKYYRIHKSGCGYTSVTKAHINHMAEIRQFG